MHNYPAPQYLDTYSHVQKVLLSAAILVYLYYCVFIYSSFNFMLTDADSKYFFLSPYLVDIREIWYQLNKAFPTKSRWKGNNSWMFWAVWLVVELCRDNMQVIISGRNARWLIELQLFKQKNFGSAVWQKITKGP